MVRFKERVELTGKNKPKQQRAKRTYEAILMAASELLVEVGVERISTNLVAERAGVSVPALYRYFPNKYAVLNALSSACIDKQSAAFQEWVEEYSEQGNLHFLLDGIYGLLKRIYDVTQQQVGGLEVVQALRAVEPLREARLAAHMSASNRLAATAATLIGRPVDQLTMAQSRLTVDSAYLIVEMALEDGSPSAESILHEGARMIRLYWQSILIGD